MSEKDNAINNFADEFTSSIGLILSSQKFSKWKSLVKELETDQIFKSENFVKYIEETPLRWICAIECERLILRSYKIS